MSAVGWTGTLCQPYYYNARDTAKYYASKSHLLLLSDEQQESHWSREQQELSDTVIFHSINE